MKNCEMFCWNVVNDSKKLFLCFNVKFIIKNGFLYYKCCVMN